MVLWQWQPGGGGPVLAQLLGQLQLRHLLRRRHREGVDVAADLLVVAVVAEVVVMAGGERSAEREGGSAENMLTLPSLSALRREPEGAGDGDNLIHRHTTHRET